LKRIFFWTTIAAGACAAYLMYKRGESLPTIARKAVLNPIGSFASEIATRS
jgi:hypothetical protein